MNTKLLAVMWAAAVAACGGDPAAKAPSNGGPRIDAGSDGGGKTFPPGKVPTRTIITGDVPGDVSHEFYIDIEEDVPHWVLTEGADYGVSLRFYATEARDEYIAACDGLVGDCIIDLPPGRYYLGITPIGKRTDYLFSVTPLVDEGSASSPIPIGSTRDYAHSVAPSGTSFYRFDAPSSGAYDLQIKSFALSEGASLPRLTIYEGDEGYGGEAFHECAPDPDGYGYEYEVECRVSGFPAGAMLLRVESQGGLAGGFTFESVRTLGHGALEDPVVLTEVPQPSGVDAWSRSIYVLETGESGSYIVTRSDDEHYEKTLFSAYPTAALDEVTSFCRGDQCSLDKLEANSSYFIIAEHPVSEAFEISAERGGAIGTPLTPIALTQDVPVGGFLEEGVSSYFEFTAPESASYRAGQRDLPEFGNLTIEWSRDGGMTSQQCHLWRGVSCSLGVLAAGESIAIRAFSRYPGDYDVGITREPP